MTATVRKSKLASLPTAELIGQYELAISSYQGRLTNSSPRQTRINYIVDLLVERADTGDSASLVWLA